MGVLTIRMPDIGEGIAEAEVTEWMVEIGQIVQEDEVLCTVMTDKATVEIPSSASGKVVWLGGELGTKMAVGADLIRLEVEGEVAEKVAAAPPPPVAEKAVAEKPVSPPPARVQTESKADARPVSASQPLRPEGERPLAPPSVRLRARDAGVDLRQLRGSGPAGRITHADLDGYLSTGGLLPATSAKIRDEGVETVKVIGLRRRIAENMSHAARIPHISIIEEVDATALEDLRARMNAEGAGAKLTFLPFIAKAIVKALREQPDLNAHYLPEEGHLRRFNAVHLGIAAQTPSGLMVPVVRHAETLGLRELGAEIGRLGAAAKEGAAKREELSGSTITITSLGPLGAIATTPLLNAPEIVIVGVNRMAVRPHWNGTAFEPRKMMNLSCSFDHRIIDGWDAAVFVNRLKTLLEAPALIFVEG